MAYDPTENEITRRSFLSRAIVGIGGLIGAVFTGIGGGYFLSPLWHKKKESWVDLGLVKDFREGVPVKVDFTVRKRDAWSTIESRSSAWIVTANLKEFIAFDPKCTHLGCPYRWSDDKKQFLCPCHTATFGIDGKVVSGPPPRPLDRYPTKVVGGHLLILPQKTAEA
ncbi:MAG: ubiquinol-cytochrome c reductase iron-sulfur subunit [Elusimicrobia bacterium]|nr:ubiquinol-cytochrome c reductase iron-sulfur subunit [Elusimicrobiota bacterium]